MRFSRSANRSFVVGSLRGLVGAVLCLVVLASTLALGVWLYVGAWSKNPISIDPARTIILAPGDSFGRIVVRLEEAALIDEPRLFALYARLEQATGSIQAGEYRFHGALTPRQLLADLVRGNVTAYNVLLPEGATFREFKQILQSNEALTFDLMNVDVQSIMPFLGISADSGEGWFFPDTYRFRRGDKATDVLDRAHAKMAATLANAWESRMPGLPYTSPYEVLTMASIIEKESARTQDRAKIAGVFVRRLQKRMRLETDPTIIYGLGEAFDGDLTRKHLNTDGPYNTYRRFGLPPTPIAAPSAESLMAATHPAEGDALFFVARGDGTSAFSATYDEHRAAVRKFQLQRN